MKPRHHALRLTGALVLATVGHTQLSTPRVEAPLPLPPEPGPATAAVLRELATVGWLDVYASRLPALVLRDVSRYEAARIIARVLDDIAKGNVMPGIDLRRALEAAVEEMREDLRHVMAAIRGDF